MGEDVPLMEHIPKLLEPGSETHYISINVSSNLYTLNHYHGNMNVTIEVPD